MSRGTNVCHTPAIVGAYNMPASWKLLPALIVKYSLRVSVGGVRYKENAKGMVIVANSGRIEIAG